MSRLIQLLLASLVVALFAGGCLLSPQPEPPDVRDIDNDYPGYYDDYASSEPPPGGEWNCDDPNASADCGGAGLDGDEDGCGCRSDDEAPGDCGHDDEGPSAIERATLEALAEAWVGFASDDQDDDPEPTAEY